MFSFTTLMGNYDKNLNQASLENKIGNVAEETNSITSAIADIANE